MAPVAVQRAAQASAYSKLGKKATTPCGTTRHTFSSSRPSSSTVASEPRERNAKSSAAPEGPWPRARQSKLEAGTMWPHACVRSRASGMPGNSAAASGATGPSVPPTSTTARAAAAMGANREPGFSSVNFRRPEGAPALPARVSSTRPSPSAAVSAVRKASSACRAAVVPPAAALPSSDTACGAAAAAAAAAASPKPPTLLSTLLRDARGAMGRALAFRRHHTLTSPQA